MILVLGIVREDPTDILKQTDDVTILKSLSPRVSLLVGM